MASLKVAVRVRPFNNREHAMNSKLIVQMDGKRTRLLKQENVTVDNNASTQNRDNFHDFTFDYSYWSFGGQLGNNQHEVQHIISQDEVYNDLGVDIINCAFQGYNACLFAYGQTGSGKTFTMMGTPESPGLIPRICKEMFNRMNVGQKSGTGYKTNVSYLEIHNERVKDLLGTDNSGCTLRIREHRNLGPYVEGLSQHPVSQYAEIQECIDRGNSVRTTASTKMNDTSSRSHAIFTITFVQAIFMDDMPSETVSKIHLVDLAGSERANATEATGDRLKEGAHINKSLVTLGSVISALAEQSTLSSQKSSSKKKVFIPYRDSNLTWLLKDSLGGNSKTIMIAAISPAECNYSETLSTLRYANRAKNIINKPTVNEDANVKLIRELREEIMKLKGMLSDIDGSESTLNNSSQVLEDLLKKEAQEKFLTEEWAEKWRQTQSILREEKTLGLRKSGLFGVILDSDAPHLIGIHDGNMTGVTLYSLKDGETIIGSVEKDNNNTNSESRKIDIALSGTGICPIQCSITLIDGTATLHPYDGAQCWLNAHLITAPQIIRQGDILLFGGTNMFRYCNPMEAKLHRNETSAISKADLSRLSLIAASRENLCGIKCSASNEIEKMESSMKLQQQFDKQTNEMEQQTNEMEISVDSSKDDDIESSMATKEHSFENDYQGDNHLYADTKTVDNHNEKLQIQDESPKDSEQNDISISEMLGKMRVSTYSTTSLEIAEGSKSQNAAAIAPRTQWNMQILRHDISTLKEHIMKNIELNNCDKTQLDEDIAKLQILQKQYIQYERENICDKHCDIACSTCDGTWDELKSNKFHHNSDAQTIYSEEQSNDIEFFTKPRTPTHVDSEYFISIPIYIIRGAGKQTHFEYEVRITLPDDKWIIMRRYSRFRELHLSMKTLYGEKVSQIPFPNREFFSSKSESTARNRRRQLEAYLRRLLVVCSKIPQCPFFEGANGYGLSKATLVEFSQFFKKGLFENGKHGTG